LVIEEFREEEGKREGAIKRRREERNRDEERTIGKKRREKILLKQYQCSSLDHQTHQSLYSSRT
jgi:hypothetical protein